MLNYLLKNGSERVISTTRDHLFELRALESYKYLDERGKDEGINVRHRVKAIIELLQDDDALRGERRKAKIEGREKYQGFSKEEMMMKGKFSNFDSWNEKSKPSNSSSSYYSDKYDKHIESGGDGVENFKRREITAFDFGETNRNQDNCSPELGIRLKTPEFNTEDDEFGDFTEARSVNTATMKSPQPKSFTIPPLSPPKTKSQQSSIQRLAKLSPSLNGSNNTNRNSLSQVEEIGFFRFYCLSSSYIYCRIRR